MLESEEDLFVLEHTKHQQFYQLMPFRIQNILLVSSYYDAFIIEEDGRLSDQIFEEFHNLKLKTLPNLSRATSPKQAFQMLEEKSFDLVITTRRLGNLDPYKFGQEIKSRYNIPVILLLNSTAEIDYLPNPPRTEGIEDVFVWNGDSKVFIAIIKFLEDQKNIDNDIEKGDVRVIILVEPSIRFYSLYLPLLYEQIMRQTHRLIAEVVNDFYNLLQMRARPKILLARTFEEATEYWNKYHQNVMGVISDLHYPKELSPDDHAGSQFIQTIRQTDSTLPIVIQSDSKETESLAHQLQTHFMSGNKKERAKLRSLTYQGWADAMADQWG